MNEFTTIGKATKETGLSYLGGVSTSAKMMHSQEYSHQYTYAIYLSPAKTSGYNVCSHSTRECSLGCLAISCHAGMEITANLSVIKNTNIKLALMFY